MTKVYYWRPIYCRKPLFYYSHFCSDSKGLSKPLSTIVNSTFYRCHPKAALSKLSLISLWENDTVRTILIPLLFFWKNLFSNKKQLYILTLKLIYININLTVHLNININYIFSINISKTYYLSNLFSMKLASLQYNIKDKW